MRSDRERLVDILEAIHKIEQYVERESDFEADELIQVWIVHHLQIIGEAASRLTQEFRRDHPEVAWGGMIGMRHILVHGYFETNNIILWKVVEQDLPVLKRQVKALLEL